MNFRKYFKEIKTLLTILGLIFQPFRNAEILKNYNKLTSNKKIIITASIKFLNCFVFTKSLHFLYLSFHKMDTFAKQFRHFDMMEVLFPNGLINLIALISTFSVIYLNVSLLIRPNFKLVKILHDVIILQDHSIFVNPNFKQWNICELIRKIYSYISNTIDSLKVIIGMIFL